MRVSPTIPPEFERASNVIEKRVERLLAHSNVLLTTSLWKNTDSLVAVKKIPKIREIPSGDGWRWNQAKRKYNTTFDKISTDVEIMKLVPRKSVRSSISRLPKLKLWQIKSVNRKTPFAAYWCEKGSDSDIEGQELNLEDYSFLAEFMEPCEGQQLWPEHPMYNSPASSTFDIDSFMNYLMC